MRFGSVFLRFLSKLMYLGHVMVMAPPSENTNGVHRIEQAAEKPAMTYVYSA
jgi:hypothetical protein